MKRAVAAILGVGALLWWWFGTGERPHPEAVVSPERPPERQTEDQPRRVTLPRPDLPTRTGSEDHGTDGPAVAADAPEAEATDEQGPAAEQASAERPYPLPVPPDRVAAAIDHNIKDLLPDMVSCLEAWGDADVTFTGKVSLGFQLDGDGLSDVWVNDVESIPDGPLTCLSGALWEHGWPPFEGETTVTYPFEVEVTHDTGGAQ